MTPEEIISKWRPVETGKQEIELLVDIKELIQDAEREAYILGMRRAALLVGLSAKEEILEEVYRLERK